MWKTSKFLALTIALIPICSFALLAQPPKGGEYHEDFSQEEEWFSEHWNPSGYIQITQENEGYIISVFCPHTLSGPFFEVDLLFVEYGNGMAGIELIPTDNTKWNYVVLLDADGYYSFLRSSHDGSQWTTSKGWTYSSNILQGTGVVNHIAIEVQPRMTMISFNGGSPTSLNASIEPGGISFAVGTFDGATTVRFDNLRVYKGTTSDME